MKRVQSGRLRTCKSPAGQTGLGLLPVSTPPIKFYYGNWVSGPRSRAEDDGVEP